MSKQVISKIIPGVCNALNKILQDEVKISIVILLNNENKIKIYKYI